MRSGASLKANAKGLNLVEWQWEQAGVIIKQLQLFSMKVISEKLGRMIPSAQYNILVFYIAKNLNLRQMQKDKTNSKSLV